MKQTLEKQMTVGFGLVFLLLLIIGAGAYLNASRLFE